MIDLRVVSVDMFGTLVDIGSRKYTVWRTFLKERYSDELAEEYWARATDLLFQYMQEQVMPLDEYIPLKTIFEVCYDMLFSEIGLDFDPKEAARVLAYQHTFSLPHGDARLFLDAVGREYSICVSSDTDDDMVPPLHALYPFDRVFTSEQLRSYKASADSNFFSAVIDYYGVGPDTMIHIGDSTSDII